MFHNVNHLNIESFQDANSSVYSGKLKILHIK